MAFELKYGRALERARRKGTGVIWEPSIAMGMPVSMLQDLEGRWSLFTPELAAREELQNHVDAAMQTGGECKIKKLGRGHYVVEDTAGDGYEHSHIRALLSGKRRIDPTKLSLTDVCSVGNKGTGSKLAGTVWVGSGVTAVKRSQDWIARTELSEFWLDDKKSAKDTVLAIGVVAGLEERITGSKTELKGLSRDASRVFDNPQQYFLYFKGENWKPMWIQEGHKWSNAGVDSIIEFAHNEGSRGEVWLQGARVPYNEHDDNLLFLYNFNSIKGPTDEYRTQYSVTDVNNSIKGLLEKCYAPNIIDSIIRRGSHNRKQSKVEWETLEEIAYKGCRNDPFTEKSSDLFRNSELATAYRKQFYRIFHDPKKRKPVIRAPERSNRTSDDRINRALGKLNADSFELNPALARFLHSCGVEYDTELVVDHEDLFLLPADEFRNTDGKAPVYVGNMAIKHAEDGNHLGATERMYALIEYARKHSRNRPDVQFLIEHNGEEILMTPEQYQSFRLRVATRDEETCLSKEGERQVRENIFGRKGELRFSLPDNIGCCASVSTDDYFKHVKGIRVVAPVQGGLDITDLGEVSRGQGKADVVYDLEPRVQRTDEQINASHLFSSVCSSAARDGSRVTMRSTNFNAKHEKRRYGSNDRVYLEALVGLREDESLKNKAAVTFIPADTKERRSLLDVLLNLESHVLHHRPGYRPIFSHEPTEIDIVSLDNNNAYFHGYKSGYNSSSIFSYNISSGVCNFSQGWNTFYHGSIRKAVIESNNKSVYRKLLEVAAESFAEDKAPSIEMCDYHKLNLEREVTFGKAQRKTMKQAFEEQFPEAILATASVVAGNLEPVKKGSQYSVSHHAGASHIIDTSVFGDVAASYSRIAEAMGYKLVKLDEGLTNTLRNSGVTDDISVVTKGCNYVEIDKSKRCDKETTRTEKRLRRSAEGGEYIDTVLAQRMTTQGLDPTERASLEIAEDIVSKIADFAGEKYEVRLFSRIEDYRGHQVPKCFTYSHVAREVKGKKKHTIYVRFDQLQNEDRTDLINSINRVAVSKEQGYQFMAKALNDHLAGQQVGIYGVIQKVGQALGLRK